MTWNESKAAHARVYWTALEHACGGNRTQMARQAGVHRGHMYQLWVRYLVPLKRQTPRNPRARVIPAS